MFLISVGMFFRFGMDSSDFDRVVLAILVGILMILVWIGCFDFG